MSYLDAFFKFLAEFFKWTNKKAEDNTTDINSVNNMPKRPKTGDPAPKPKIDETPKG